MLQEYLQILRVFGLSGPEISAILRAVRDEGCSGLRLLERDGEYAVCLQTNAPTWEMARNTSERWAQKLRDRFGDALYAEGETTLAQATLNALLDKRRLLVTVDETTGRLLGDALQELEYSESAYDFGTQTYLHGHNMRRIMVPPTIRQRFPGDAVQDAAGRALAALVVARADHALAYMPAGVDHPPFVMLCDRQGAVAHAVDPELSDGAIANALLDLVRRRVLGLQPRSGAVVFRPGYDKVTLELPQEPETAEMPDIPETPETQQPQQPPEPQDPPVSRGATTRFHKVRPKEEEQLMNAVPAEPQPRRGGIVMESDLPDPPPSLLDGDVPDFRMDPPPAAAPAFFPDDQTAAVPAQPASAPYIPQPVQPANNFYSQPQFYNQPNVGGLYDQNVPQALEGVNGLRTSSLEKIERQERRKRIITGLVLALLLLILLAGGFALWRFFRGNAGKPPAARTYGTSGFDDQAAVYLAGVREEQPDVVGYLAFPGREGRLVYVAESAEPQSAALCGTSYLGAEMPGHTVLSVDEALAELAELETLRGNSGFTLYLPNRTYRFRVMAAYYADPTQQGAGAFDPNAYGDLSDYGRYLSFVLNTQIRSLYETGVQAGLNASFVTLTTRQDDGTLFCVTGRLVKSNESAQLGTTQVQQAAEPLLTAAQYAAAGRSMPDVRQLLARRLEQYAADRSTLSELTAKSGNSGSDLNNLQQQLDDLHQYTQGMLAQAEQLLMQGLTDVAGSTGASESNVGQSSGGGNEGALPERQVAVPTPKPAATPTPEPTPVPTPTPTPEPGTTPAPTPAATPTPKPTPTPAPEVETLDVTMNGSKQSIELVRCLAMIAQNELGSSAPAEAYKAQCVAAHCWIMSQSGYPSVLGQEPGPAALAAAEEVAHVLVTYNGAVAFTPYFASASKGTASSADVWGGQRAWLQPVDSPYDEQVATNWHTNGATSGTARFSRATLQARIQNRLNIDLSNVDPNEWFKILSANEYGWVSRIQIGPDGGTNTSCTGTWFRETLLAGQSVDGRSLRSQCFTVTYDADLDCFIFDVYGYGHGCGMSQWGAIGYARNGWSYDNILKHYYTGTTLVTY